MIRDRQVLTKKLKTILESDNVYFQPPQSKDMTYPAIKYVRSNIENKSANNSKYLSFTKYTITLMDFDPDSKYFLKMTELPEFRFERQFTLNNLYHFVFTTTL